MSRARHAFGLAALLAAFVLAQGAYADNAPRPADMTAVKNCLASAKDGKTCIGVVANPCQDQPDGYTTLGIGDCLERERLVWDALLNAEWPGHMADARRFDRDKEPSAPSLAHAMRKSERAWITYRDAECAMQVATWGAGSGRGPAGSRCLMHLTAERVLDLRALLSEEGQ